MTQEIEQYITKRRIPRIIPLRNREGLNETNLVLSDAEVNSESGIVMFIYKIKAMFPYRVVGDKNDIAAVDFSEGPMIEIGYVIKGMEVRSIETGSIKMTQVS